MTPQERQLIDDLFDRLAKLESAPRDPEAMSAIMQGLRNAPNAVYALVQTALVQDEALKRADMRIQELEAVAGRAKSIRRLPRFDARRDLRAEPVARFAHGSVPNVRAPEMRRQPPGLEHAARSCSRPSRPDNTISRPTASSPPMARTQQPPRSAAAAARFSAPRRRPRPAWSAARCWPAASAR